VVKSARVHAFVQNKLLVPAGIVVVRGVERLVQVADEVQLELQCQELLGSTGGPIAELGRELINLVDHAGVRRTFRSRDAGRKRRMSRFNLSLRFWAQRI
jgi:hypothetical protein